MACATKEAGVDWATCGAHVMCIISSLIMLTLLVLGVALTKYDAKRRIVNLALNTLKPFAIIQPRALVSDVCLRDMGP